MWNTNEFQIAKLYESRFVSVCVCAVVFASSFLSLFLSVVLHRFVSFSCSFRLDPSADKGEICWAGLSCVSGCFMVMACWLQLLSTNRSNNQPNV